MDLGLTGKIALVAGSSKGLGQAIARGLAAEGASLVLCARNAEQLEKAAQEIRRAGAARAIAVPADLATAAGIAQVLAAAHAEFGHVDILVNNTGGPPAGRFEDLAPDAWDQAVRLLLASAVNLTRGVLAEMKRRRWGRIVNITSIAVKQPMDNMILSNSIRAAVTGFARTLANEVAPFGVTVNNVLPGYTRTSRLDYLAEKIAAEKGVAPADVFGKWESEIPMGRLAEPRELADVVTFLASQRAAYVTGVSLAVDGGWVRSLL